MKPIELAVRTMRKRQRLKKPKALLFPLMIEHKFRQQVKRLVGKMRAAVNEIIVPELSLLAKPRKDASRLASERIDATDAEKLADLIRATRLSLEDDFSDEAIARMVSDIGDEISGYNRLEVARVFKSVLGVDLMSAEPNMDELISAFVRENVSLIKSVESQYLGEVEQVVLRGLRTGLRAEAMAKQLTGESEVDFVSRIGKAESRAELIARDQTNKFYGQLTEARQAAAGIDKYIWRTALDERVRPEHVEREGEVFSWDAPPSDGHPGEAINCRCYAEPVIEIEEA